MTLSSAAKQAGATEDKAFTFDDRVKQLLEEIKHIEAIRANLAESAADTTHTGKTATIQMNRLAVELAVALEATSKAIKLVDWAHINQVTPPDRGSLANVARAFAAEEGQFEVTQRVNAGVNQNEEAIAQLAQKQAEEKQVAYLPERINQKPDPLVPSEGLKPTIEQAWTHAMHEAIKADNPSAVAVIWGVFNFSIETFQTFLMESYQVAGYYQPPGPISKLTPKSEVFNVFTTGDYLNYLSDEQLNNLLIALAGHQSARGAEKELEQFLVAIPEARKANLHYVDALNAAMSQSIKQITHIKIMLPHLPQKVIDDGYALIASKQERMQTGTESGPIVEIATLLLEKASKPLPADTLMAIAKTGYPENLRRALEDENNVGFADLPEVIASVTTPPFVGAEDKVISVLKKIKAHSVTMEPERWQAVLDHAVINGQENLLRELVVLKPVKEQLNELESRTDHENFQGNRILYKAAQYIGRVRADTDTKGKADDVAKALKLATILMKGGAKTIIGETNVTVSSILTERVEKDNKALANNESLRTIQEEFNLALLARRERTLARARAETEIEVRREQGLLPSQGHGDSNRLTIEAPQSPALPPRRVIRGEGPVIDVDPETPEHGK